MAAERKDLSAESKASAPRDSRPDARLPRRNRLRSQAEWDHVWRTGVAARDRWLTVKAVRRQGDDEPRARLGISVGRRHGNAVQRNRWKRWVREAWRRHQAAFHRGPWDVIVRPHPDAVADYHLVDRSLVQLMTRVQQQLLAQTQLRAETQEQ